MTSISSSGSSSNSRRNSSAAFSIHHLLGNSSDDAEDGGNQGDSKPTRDASDNVTTPVAQINKVDGRSSADLMHAFEESLSPRPAVGCDAGRLADVLRMLSSFIANLSRLHQNVPLSPVRQLPPIMSQMLPILHLKSTEGDRVGYSCDSDQSASLETGGKLEAQELQSSIAGGALSSLINMTFSKMLTLAEAKTLKDQVLKAQDSVPPVLQLSTNKLRKTRTTFTTSQLAQLEVYFGRQKYLTPADRDHIAGELGLSSAQRVNPLARGSRYMTLCIPSSAIDQSRLSRSVSFASGDSHGVEEPGPPTTSTVSLSIQETSRDGAEGDASPMISPRGANTAQMTNPPVTDDVNGGDSEVITWFQNRRAKNRRERLELERDILVSRRKRHLKNGPLRTAEPHSDRAFVECQPNPDSEGGLSTDRTIFPGSMLL